jgi:long-chain acyl-CoA synthetase
MVVESSGVGADPGGTPGTSGSGRVVARLARVVEGALGDVGLSLPQYRLLALLADGSSAAAALAERLAVSRPSITALVDGLVHRDYVERRPDPDDRRRVSHTLTGRGRAALDAGDVAVDAAMDRLAGHLPPERVPPAHAALADWGAALDAARAERARHR